MKYKEKMYMNLPALVVCGVLLTATALTSAAAAERQAPSSEKLLHDIAIAPSAENLETDIRKLVSFGTRHTLSETRSEVRGIGAARRWIRAEFEAISAAGYREPNRYVVMSGDIDSRVSDPLDGESDSPGANDNASGMAGAIEAARVLSRYRFPASIIYVGLSGEEQGLYGGQIMATAAREQGWEIEALLNNDMIGNISGVNGVIDNSSARVFSEGTRVVETAEEARRRRFTGGEVDSPSRNLARYVDTMADRYLPNLDVMMIYRLDRFGRGGHHRPFNDAGYPAVRIMETNEHYDRQHQDLREEDGVAYGDVIEGVDFDYAATLTALNAVTLASLAAAPAPPRDVAISGAVSPSARLEWQKVPGAVDYKVYWRLTTSPVWTHSRAVGDVSEATMHNLVIDNYLFGIASVAEGGFESPVVFPGPAGSFYWQPPESE
jgi:hypothetical protein